MSRYLIAALAVILAAPFLSAAPVPPEGAKGIVFPYPTKAPIVVCLSGYDKARDHLSKLLAAALPKEAPAITKLINEQLDKFLEGRKLTAVPKDARAFFVVNDLGALIEGTHAVSVLVPITTYKDFLESFLTKDETKTLDKGADGVDAIKTFATGEEHTVFIVDLKDYAALAIDKETAEHYAAKYTAGCSEAMGSEAAETFLKADVALYVNMDAINEKFGEQIHGFKRLIDFALQQAQQQGALGTLNAKQLDALKVIFKGVLQGVEDCRSIVLAAEFRTDGLMLRLQAQFADNSPSAKLLGLEHPAALTDLAKMPAGLGLYQGVHFGKTIREVIHALSEEFATTEDDERGAALIEQHMKDLASAGGSTEFTATLAPGAAISVASYKDAQKASKAITKAFKAVAAGGRINGIVVKTAPRVSDEAETYRDFTFSSIVLTHDFEASVAGLPEPARDAALDQFKRAVTEKMTQWVGTDGKLLVRVIAKDWKAASEMLAKYVDGKGTLGASAGFKRVREQLPPEANFLLIADVEAAITGAVASVKSVTDVIPGIPKIGPLKKLPEGDAAYVGLAVTLKGDTATVTAFVPVEAIRAGRNILESLFKKFE
jgi:hypothetical protein